MFFGLGDVARLAGRAFARSWGRDVMLYTGGVSFFALLAVFPAIAILIGFYKLGLSITEVSAQAAALSDLLPNAAQAIFQGEITRLSNASARTVSARAPSPCSLAPMPRTGDSRPCWQV